MEPSAVERTWNRHFEGRTLGGYRVLRAIAAGGMATLYLARKTGVMGFSQNAALKVVHPHLAGEKSFVAMFLDEARIASCINHPNVCRVLDFGEVDGTYFLAMEYVRGESLAELLAKLRREPISYERMEALSCWVLAQACEGLHAAHEAHGSDGEPLHIVHRDVSPQNLLLGYDGSVRIVDFGIAYAAERSQSTRDGAVRGRYGYMAPEQMRSLPVDRRADIWSLGVMLREALEGRRLFARDSDAATIYSVTEQPLPDWLPQVPPSLRAVADKALSRDPAGRFASAREMGQELTRAIQGRAIGSADLSQLMQSLFPEQIASKAALLRELAARATQELPSVEQPLEEPTSAPPVVDRPSHSAVREVSQLLSRATQQRRWLWPVGALALLGLLLLAWPKDKPTLQSTAQSSATPPARPAQAKPPQALPPSLGPVVAPLVEPLPAESAPDAAVPSQASQPAKPRRAQKGSVAIGATGGWATVALDGRQLGTTPLRVSLPVGSHTLLVRKMGKGPVQRVKIEVRAGESTRVILPL